MNRVDSGTMCGRAYSTYSDEELGVRYRSRRPIRLAEVKPNFNFSPSQDHPVLRIVGSEPGFDLLRWGLVPSWAKDTKIGFKMINARSETVAEKPAFRNAFIRRRCIVPVSGFIEWKREGESKKPHCIFLRDQPIMSLAGIWECWKPEEGVEVSSFAILTTQANAFMSRIHDRMPVILGSESEDEWLDPENRNAGRLNQLLKPCPDQWLGAYEISPLINSPRSNRRELLEPLSAGE